MSWVSATLPPSENILSSSQTLLNLTMLFSAAFKCFVVEFNFHTLIICVDGIGNSPYILKIESEEFLVFIEAQHFLRYLLMIFVCFYARTIFLPPFIYCMRIRMENLKEHFLCIWNRIYSDHDRIRHSKILYSFYKMVDIAVKLYGEKIR